MNTIYQKNTLGIQATIYAVSAPCGAGKTRGASEYISDNLTLWNWMFISPSKILQEQTQETLLKNGVSSALFNSDTHKGYVKSAIMECMKSADPAGMVLQATYASYITLPYINRPENWKIIVDEIPQVDEFYDPLVHQHLHVIRDHIKLGDPITEKISTVVPRDLGGLRRLVEQSDDITALYRDLYFALLSDNRDVFVYTESWNKMIEEGDIDEGREDNKIYFLTMLRPTPFKNCILLGANLEQSMLHHWFTTFHDVTFRTHEEIYSKMYFNDHLSSNISSCVKMHYLLDDPYSKYVVLKNADLQTQMDEEVINHFDQSDFLYVVNKSYSGRIRGASNATNIPTVSHGINSYSHFTNIYFGPALNRQPIHTNMLVELGFSKEYIKTATLDETAYQSVMRTALRDKKSNEVVNVVVNERGTALFLAKLLGVDADLITKIGNIEVKYPPYTQAEKNSRYKFNKIRNIVCNDSDKVQHVPSVGYFFPIASIQESTPQTATDINANNGSSPPPHPDDKGMLNLVEGKHYITIVIDKYKTLAKDFDVAEFDNMGQVIRGLKDMHRTVIVDEKTEAFMLCSATFNKTDPKSTRLLDNFEQSSMLILDIDGGYTKEEFVGLFGESGGKKKLSFCICNSFSCTPDEPDRFRVFIPYTKPITSVDQHKAAYDHIAQMLFDEYGRWGIDPASKNANQPYYVPCTNRAYKEYAFFETHYCQKREIQRYGIDPDILKIPVPIKSKKIPAASVPATASWNPRNMGSGNTHAVSSIKKEYQDVPVGIQKRRRAFFTAASRMNRVLPIEEVEDHLIDLAGADPKIRGRVPDIIDQLRKENGATNSHPMNKGITNNQLRAGSTGARK